MAGARRPGSGWTSRTRQTTTARQAVSSEVELRLTVGTDDMRQRERGQEEKERGREAEEKAAAEEREDGALRDLAAQADRPSQRGDSGFSGQGGGDGATDDEPVVSARGDTATTGNEVVRGTGGCGMSTLASEEYGEPATAGRSDAAGGALVVAEAGDVADGVHQLPARDAHRTHERPGEEETKRDECVDIIVVDEVIDDATESKSGSVQVLRAAVRRATRAWRRACRPATLTARQDCEAAGVEAVSEHDGSASPVGESAPDAEDGQPDDIGKGGGDGRAQVQLVQQRAGSGEGADGDGESVQADDGLPTAIVHVRGESRQIKLDSGARFTVAGAEWTAYGRRLSKRPPVQQIEGIGGFVLEVVGVWAFRLQSAYGQWIEVEACVLEGCGDEFLLGLDFMVRHDAQMDFRTHEIRYSTRGNDVILPFKTFAATSNQSAVVRVARASKVRTETITQVDVVVAAGEGEVGVFVPTYTGKVARLAPTVAVARGGKLRVPVLNALGRRVKLPAREELGKWVPVADDLEVLQLGGELAHEKVEAWVKTLAGSDRCLAVPKDITIGTEDESQRALILKLLASYRDVLESKDDSLPTAVGVRHHVDTGDHVPIMLKRRRQAQMENEIVEENVRKMLKAGVIEEGSGAWGFPVVLVKKKDGEIRFCIDYRQLNAVTKRDVYPLPRIDETLEAIGGARLFSTLDLRSGYWQVEMAEGDKDKTAFVTQSGLYRFTRMPFGLMNAPSTFQRMMNCVLRGLTWLTCLVYLDDIIVYSKGSVEQHVVQLAMVLERLRSAGLGLKPKKCSFAMGSIEYLGHELNPEGIRPVERLVTAVREFPAPDDPKEAKRFAHLAGYYRRFVDGFGTLMAPITKLLRKGVKWEWGPTQQAAFDEVKRVLTTKPLLIYPDFSRHFTLVTDASTVGLGACLMQDHGNGMQPVAYASKVNDETVAKYAITELECLAVVWAVKLFRPYLYGRSFTIITDHAALKWLMTSSDLAGRLHRWALTLQEYSFNVEYRPGRTNVVADSLSRAPLGTASDDERGVGHEDVGVVAMARRRPQPQVLAGERRLTRSMTAAATRPGDAERGDVVHVDAPGGTTTNDAVVDNMRTGTTPPTKGRHLSEARDDASEPVQKRRRVDAQSGTEGMRGNDVARQGDAPVERDGPTVRLDVVAAGEGGATARQGGVAAADGGAGSRLGNGVAVNLGGVLAPRDTAVSAGVVEVIAGTAGREAVAGRRGAVVKRRDAGVVRVDDDGEQNSGVARSGTGADRSVGFAEQRNGEQMMPMRETTGPAGSRAAGGRRGVRGQRGPARGSAGHGGVEANVAVVPPLAPWLADERSMRSRGAGVELSSDGRAEHRADAVCARDAGDAEAAARDKQRGREADEPTLQVTDAMISEAQETSKLVDQLRRGEGPVGVEMVEAHGLVMVKTEQGRRIVLPGVLRNMVMKECHDSIWAGHLRGPQTHARVAQLYWWPGMRRDINIWVAGCQDCGSRKARPRAVIPPLRSLRGGAVGDRWALDVAGPFPTKVPGVRKFVVAAVEYVTRYAVARVVERHTALEIASFLLDEIVLKHGPFRELLTDGASEMVSGAVELLALLLQAEQINPVPYRPQMIGLVERFHRTWKDCVSLFIVQDDQVDWEQWVNMAVYAYNSAKQATVGISPNELMIGRRLRSPNELLRQDRVEAVDSLPEYHRTLITTMKAACTAADKAMAREQERQARYYNRRARQTRTFRPGDFAWLFRPPTDAGASKFDHRWVGPVKIVEDAGYDNFLVRREDQVDEREEYIVHVSFLVSFHFPSALLQRHGDDLLDELADEEFGSVGGAENQQAAEAERATVAAARAPRTGVRRRAADRQRTTARRLDHTWQGQLVEVRRRRRRNKFGRYILEYAVRRARDAEGADHPARAAAKNSEGRSEHARGAVERGGDVEEHIRRVVVSRRASSRGRAAVAGDDGGVTWLSVSEYEQLWRHGRLEDEPGGGEVV